MKRIILITLFFSSFLGTTLFSQEINSTDSHKKLAIKLSYFGEFVMHPGFAGGIEYSIHQNQRFNLHWDSELGTYSHKWNNNALFAQTTLGTRFISSFSIFVDVNAGIGYMLSSPSGYVYSVNANNELTTNEKPFTSHLKPNISILFGWDGTRKKNIPFLIHTGIEAYWQSNFNNSMLPHAAWRLGIVYKLKK